MADPTDDTPKSAAEEVADLRAQMETLTTERVQPAFATVSAKAEGYANQAKAVYGDQAQALSQRIRRSPLTALLLGLGGGYMVGRIIR